MSEYSKQYYQKTRRLSYDEKRRETLRQKRLLAKYVERKLQGDRLSRDEELYLRGTYVRYIKKCSDEINVYAYRSISRIGESFNDEICAYYGRFPFESFGETYIKRELWRQSIGKNHTEYDEYYDAIASAFLSAFAFHVSVNVCNAVIDFF